MKQLFTTITISVITSFLFLSQAVTAQCQLGYEGLGGFVMAVSPGFPPPLWGQSFTAECDGALEYVQITSGGTGTVSAGTLNVYSGNTVSGTPIYTQSHPAITIENVGDPIRVNITDELAVTKNSQYTFELTIDNVAVKANIGADAYLGGNNFENGVGETFDFVFEVSIVSTLSIDDFSTTKNVRLFPNPSSDYIVVSNLQKNEKYSITNALGQELIEGDIENNEQIDISNFINGLYFLRFDNGNTFKFLKE